MSVIAKPVFNAPVLSARQINSLSSYQNAVFGRSKTPSVAQALNGVAVDEGSGAYARAWEGSTIHLHDADHDEYLYYDVQIENDASNGQPAYVRLFYAGVEVAELSRTAAGSSRERGMVDLSTLDPHPADGERVELLAMVYRAAGGSPPRTEAWVYWLDEVPVPQDYQALDSATALTAGEDATVAADLQQLSDNVETLDNLSRTFFPGFRCIKGEIANWSGSYTEKTIGTWRWRTNMNGYLRYRVVFANQRANPNGWISLKVYANTSYLLGTIERPAGGTGLVEGELEITGVSPTPAQQMILRLHAVLRYDNMGEGTCQIEFLGEDGEGAGDFVQYGSAAHLDIVYGDGGSPGLRTLWDSQAALAGDAGTGYGSDGYDVSAGYPIGHAIVHGRNQAVEGAHRPGAAPRGLHSIVQSGGRPAQMICVCRTGAPYLYVRSHGAELRYLTAGEENTEAVDDEEQETLGYAVLDVSAMQIMPGDLYWVRAFVDQDEENYLDFAMEGMA